MAKRLPPQFLESSCYFLELSGGDGVGEQTSSSWSETTPPAPPPQNKGVSPASGDGTRVCLKDSFQQSVPQKARWDRADAGPPLWVKHAQFAKWAAVDMLCSQG